MTPEGLDAEHDEALTADADLIGFAHEEALEYHRRGTCRVCGRVLTRAELVVLTHPIVLCEDCRGVEGS